MAISLPLPIRVAAGLVASSVDRLRHLPEELPSLAVTIGGQAMRASMRVQQQIAELATRGDEALAGLRGSPPENPPWATFDDDGSATGPTEAMAADDRADVAAAAAADTTEPERIATPPKPVSRNTSRSPRPRVAPATRTTTNRATAATEPVPEPATPLNGPLPGYPDLSLAQLRGHLRRLSAEQVAEVLQQEQAGPARAPFLTLLTNRLASLGQSPP